jgi:hypothetical protein
MVAVCVVLTGCDLAEDETDCMGEMHLTFRFTREGQNNFGPQVPSLSVFVFDQTGIFLGRWDENDNTKFGSDYVMTLPLSPGTYSFVAWGGLNDTHYSLGGPGGTVAPVIGETHIDDMLVRVACNHSSEVTFIPATQFHGEALDRSVVAGHANDITIDLVRNSTEIQLTILGLPEPGTRVSPFTQMSLWLNAANGGYDFHNLIEYAAQTMTYREQGTDGATDNALVTSFHTLRMQLKDRNNSNISYKYILWNSQTASVYHTADLLHDYIYKTEGEKYNTQAKIDEVDLFRIKIDLNPYVGVSVTVNDFKVHSTGSVIQ